jgi:nucleoside diphosphate kinase
VLLVKAYANTATDEYMGSREVHFLARLDNSGLQLAGELMAIGQKFGLTANKIKTSSVTQSTDIIQVNQGDVIIEFVSTAGVEEKFFVNECTFLSPGVQVLKCSIAEIDEVIKMCASGGAITVPNGVHATLLMVKPHVLKSRQAGHLLKALTESGFNIQALLSVHLNMSMCKYLLDVYRGIYPNFSEMMGEVTSGPLLAVMVTSRHETLVSEIRDLTGPLEPALARKLRPKSLRALFGTDTARNAVHCTDLPEDGTTECNYLFDTIANI